MTFTLTYGAVLSPFVQPFKEVTTEKERTAVIKTAVGAVKRCKALLEELEDLPQDLPTVCLFPASYIFAFIYKASCRL